MWSCVRFQPHRENLARQELQRIGYEIYVPRIRVRRYAHGRKIETESLLFPSYGFLVVELQWHAARFSPGVLNLIMDGLRPARVPDDVIAKLKASERGGYVVLPKQPKPTDVGFQKGDRLRIRSGPFRGLFGLFEHQLPRDRIIILMQWLGTSRPTELALADVVRV
jgi:transcription antitermination factor NusG